MAHLKSPRSLSACSAAKLPEGRRRVSLARLLSGISRGASALLLSFNANSAHAQAVIGTPSIQFGIETVIRDAPTSTDTVVVSDAEALLDWQSTSPDGIFLPQGATLNFTGGSGRPSGFTVLNRVASAVAGGPLSISGTVASDSGAKVWFYNPGGWAVGPTGRFDVGSLVLSALPVTVDPSTDTVSRLLGDKGEIRFGQASDPAASVSLASGAQINAAFAAGSYVALVAPRVVQGGTVQVDGSTAMIAAEAATLTINNGLFDIIVDSGSTDAVGIEHTGTTTGPDSVSGGPDHRIHIVAVPKNQAMTAMISGSLGYAAAQSASVVNGSVVLSAGYNVAGGSADETTAVGQNASLAISNLSATGDVRGYAASSVDLDATTGNVAFAADALFRARGDVNADVASGHQLSTGGTLDLLSGNGAGAGNITITVASGGSLVTGSDFTAESSATAPIITDPENGDALLADSIGAAATAGDVTIAVNDGDFAVGGTMTLRSRAQGGVGAVSAGQASAGTVSFIAVQPDPAGPIRNFSFGDVLLTSTANDEFTGGPPSPQAGAAASSGDVTFRVDGGVFASGALQVQSIASAIFGTDPAPGTTSAGAVDVSLANGADDFSADSFLVGNAAITQSGGGVALGDVGLAFDGAALFMGAGNIDLFSYTQGGSGLPNLVSLDLTNGASVDAPFGNVFINAGASDSPQNLVSGNVAITLDNASLTLSDVFVSTYASVVESGLNAVGGDVTLTVRNGATFSTAGTASISSYASGGDGADGGDGTGGNVRAFLDNATINVGTLSIDSTGAAGTRTSAGGRSGRGFGGMASYTQTGAQSIFGGDLSLTAFGDGRGDESLPDGPVRFGRQAGSGALGLGGTATASISDGLFNAGFVGISADALGGGGFNVAGAAPGVGGNGTGGRASVLLSGGSVTTNTLRVGADGYAGNGADQNTVLGIAAGKGGDGTGGTGTVALSGGELAVENLLLSADGNLSLNAGEGSFTYYGVGGRAIAPGAVAGNGGNGRGGSALLEMTGGTLVSTLAPNGPAPRVVVSALAEGGRGGAVQSPTINTGATSGSGAQAAAATRASIMNPGFSTQSGSKWTPPVWAA